MTLQPKAYSQPFHQKMFYWYSLLMAFPVILLAGQNLSVLIFPVLVFTFYKTYGYIFRLDRFEVIPIVYFGVGALLSSLNILLEEPVNQVSFDRALAVLPNYLYWAILLLFLLGQRDNFDPKLYFRAVFYGVILSILYYFFLQNLGLRALPLFKPLTANNLAFLLIIFSPVAVFYALKRNLLLGYGLILFLIIAGFLSGSRSASVLVLAESMITLGLFFRDRLQIVMIAIIIIAPVFTFLNEFGIIEDVIEQLNPRAHELLYDTENVVQQDRSYLIRQAMIEKGMIIFEDNPYFGIGLNNFTYTDVELQGNFEGAKYVINKDIETGISSHNSYINLLAEGGLLTFVPFISLFVTIFIRTLFNLRNLSEESLAVFVGFCGLVLHFYFINAVVNVFAWLTIGMCCAFINRKREAN